MRPGNEQPAYAYIGKGAYTLNDASLMLRIPLAKLQRRTHGYWYTAADDERFSGPVVSTTRDGAERHVMSFQELVELAVVDFFRREGVSMYVVRAARSKAQTLFQTKFPFATMRFRTNGCGICSDISQIDDVAPKQLQLELSKSQLAHTELVEPFFRENVDFSKDGSASTFWPLGKAKPVTIDPGRSYGRSMVRRTGTPTFMLYQMHEAGEPSERIVQWYDISPFELDAALEYESGLRTAA